MLEVLHTSKSYGTFKAVNDISFSISEGHIVGLLGPNGAGKTTTMKMITGFLKPDSGKIMLDGKDITQEPELAKSKIGYMPENVPFYSDMIVEQYLSYIAELYGLNKEERISKLASECALLPVMHKNIGELSRGYRQRLGLAHALMNDPQILVLDEPTSGLDPNQISSVRSLIKEIGKTRTVIISTHILSEVEMMCDRSIIVANGRIAADISMEKLKKHNLRGDIFIQLGGCTKQELLEGLTRVQNIKSVILIKNATHSKQGFVSAVIRPEQGTDLRPQLYSLVKQTDWTLYEMTQRHKSLEDIFHNLTARDDFSQRQEQ